jgi:AcrR family transcriptional regulator
VNPVTHAATSIDDESPPTRPLRADAVRNQQRILAAARELFAARGLDITLDAVAEHAGVGVGTVYRRFANKHELIAEVFEAHVRGVVEQAHNAMHHPDPWEALVEFLEYMCRELAANRGLSQVVRIMESADARLAYVREHMEPAVRRVIERAQNAGVLRPGIDMSDFFSLIHMVDAVAVFASPVNTTVWRRYFDIILDGMRADSLPRVPITVGPLTNEEIAAGKLACAARR